MINNSWSSEESQGWLTLNYLKLIDGTKESMMIKIPDIKNVTEEFLQNSFYNMLSDRDIMLAFKILLKYENNHTH
jgi:hypothetical protein